MGFFNRFRKPKAGRPAPTPPGSGLPSISYAIAYFVLPQGAFNDRDKFVALWRDTATPAGARFYRMGCLFHKVEPAVENEALFRASHGPLDDTTDYYLLEYPAPPRLDFLRVIPGKNPADIEVPVLAPWFSALVHYRETGAVAYYVLGQSPVGGGSTLRSVTPDGVNHKLGPGPEPTPGDFLECVRSIASPAI